MGSFKGIEEVDVKIFGGFKVVEDAVEEDKSGCRVRRWFDCLLQNLLKFDPILDFDNGEEKTDEGRNALLN